MPGWRSVHVTHVCGLDSISLDSSPFTPPQALLLGLGLGSPLSGSHGLHQGGLSKFSSQILAGTSNSACGRVPFKGQPWPVAEQVDFWPLSHPQWTSVASAPKARGAKATEGERSKVDV